MTQPAQDPKSRNASRNLRATITASVIALAVIGTFAGTIYYQSRWRERVKEEVEREMEEWRKINKPIQDKKLAEDLKYIQKLDEDVQRSFEDIQRSFNLIDEAMRDGPNLKDDSYIVSLGFGTTKTMGEIRDYAAKNSMNIEDAIAALKLAATQKALDDAKAELEE